MTERKRLITALLFSFGFLIAQSIIVLAEFNHSLHEDETECSFCLASPHGGTGLTDNNSLDTNLTHQHEKIAATRQQTTTSVAIAYAIRAPPLS